MKILFREANISINKCYLQSVNSSLKNGTVVGNTVFKCPIFYLNILFDITAMRLHI